MQKRNFRPNRSNFRPKHSQGNKDTNSRVTHVIPAPGILESYEELAPGASKIIVDMAKLEQEHRHKWENNSLKEMKNLAQRGQYLGVVLAVAILCVTMMLAGHTFVAVVTVLGGFGFLGVTTYVNSGHKRFIHKGENRHRS
jgi:uncharacterized membrane protein